MIHHGWISHLSYWEKDNTRQKKCVQYSSVIYLSTSIYLPTYVSICWKQANQTLIIFVDVKNILSGIHYTTTLAPKLTSWLHCDSALQKALPCSLWLMDLAPFPILSSGLLAFEIHFLLELTWTSKISQSQLLIKEVSDFLVWVLGAILGTRSDEQTPWYFFWTFLCINFST